MNNAIRRAIPLFDGDFATRGFELNAMCFFLCHPALEKMLTFAVGAAPVYDNADEGWGLPVYKSFTGHPALSRHVTDSLAASPDALTGHTAEQVAELGGNTAAASLLLEPA